MALVVQVEALGLVTAVVQGAEQAHCRGRRSLRRLPRLAGPQGSRRVRKGSSVRALRGRWVHHRTVRMSTPCNARRCHTSPGNPVHRQSCSRVSCRCGCTLVRRPSDRSCLLDRVARLEASHDVETSHVSRQRLHRRAGSSMRRAPRPARRLRTPHDASVYTATGEYCSPQACALCPLERPRGRTSGNCSSRLTRAIARGWTLVLTVPLAF